MKKKKKGRVSPKKRFLLSISKEIKTSLDNGTSYSGIKRAINKIYNINLSTQIIATFAHNELGIEKKSKSKTKNNILDDDKIVNSSDDIRDKIKSKKDDEDSL